jgi:hypothetical protein
MQSIQLGKATIQPKIPLVAGSFETLTYTYTAGHSIDDSGYVMIAFRSAGDFGIPQFIPSKQMGTAASFRGGILGAISAHGFRRCI